MDQPGKVANPARGQLNRENEYSHSIILTDVRRGIAIHRRTKYHLSRNRAVLLVACSVLTFSSRIPVGVYVPVREQFENRSAKQNQKSRETAHGNPAQLAVFLS